MYSLAKDFSSNVTFQAILLLNSVNENLMAVYSLVAQCNQISACSNSTTGLYEKRATSIIVTS